MTFILAIDQSTSATKAILLDGSGGCIDQVSREHRQVHPRPGWVEHDLGEIWSNLLDAVAALRSRRPTEFDALGFVSITNQRETVAVLDRRTGDPLHPAVVWQCRRGLEICRELDRAGHGAEVARKTGLRLDPYFSGSKLAWLMRNHPELRGLLRRGDAVIATIDAWLVHRLTGGAVFATDSTNASRTLLFDLTRLDWDEDLCRLFEVPPSALPAVRESASRFGETDLAGMLPRRVPICGVMGDSQASLFAQRCFTPGMVKATLGTGSSILLNIGSGWTCAPGGSVATLAWVLDGRPTFALEGIINCSAATIAWLRDQVGLLARSGEAGERAAAVADNGGVYLVPAFAGLGAPHWRPEARGAIVGLTAHTTRNHIIRAAEESIAYQIRDVLEMLRREARIPLQCLRADGGPTRDRFLMQFIADMLRMPVEAADAAGGSALGAAMAGMVGMGWRSGLEGLLELPREATGYAPLMEAEMAERLAAEWAVAVRRVF